jgi:integrase
VAQIVVRQGKNGPRYSVRIEVQGHKESKTFGRKTDAQAWAKKREVELRERPHLADARGHTLADAIDRYIRDYLPDKSESMQRDQARQLRWFRERYGQLTLDRVQPPVLVEARDALRRQPKQAGRAGTFSAASVNRHLAALSIVLSLATREWHWIATNPMTAVNKLKEPQGRVRYLSDEERVRLLDACRSSESEHLLLMVLMLLWTGAREREVLGLRWRDIELEAGVLRFMKTKTKVARSVSIGGEALDLLKAREGKAGELVFPGPKPVDPQAEPKPWDHRSAWETALKRAGIADFRVHDLRHTTASYLAMEGVSLAQIAAVLGHRTLQMVSRYSHLSPEHVAKASARIGARLGISANPGAPSDE